MYIISSFDTACATFFVTFNTAVCFLLLNSHTFFRVICAHFQSN